MNTQHSEVQNPGSRGGKFYVDSVGRTRYGSPPAGEATRHLTPDDHRERARGYRDAAKRRRAHIESSPDMPRRKVEEFQGHAAEWEHKAQMHEHAAEGMEFPDETPEPPKPRRGLRGIIAAGKRMAGMAKADWPASTLCVDDVGRIITKAEQLSLFGKPREDVKAPGSRGGKYYVDGKGKVQYGAPPTGRQTYPNLVAANVAAGTPLQREADAPKKGSRFEVDMVRGGISHDSVVSGGKVVTKRGTLFSDWHHKYGGMIRFDDGDVQAVYADPSSGGYPVRAWRRIDVAPGPPPQQRVADSPPSTAPGPAPGSPADLRNQAIRDEHTASMQRELARMHHEDRQELGLDQSPTNGVLTRSGKHIPYGDKGMTRGKFDKIHAHYDPADHDDAAQLHERNARSISADMGDPERAKHHIAMGRMHREASYKKSEADTRAEAGRRATALESMSDTLDEAHTLMGQGKPLGAHHVAAAKAGVDHAQKLVDEGGTNSPAGNKKFLASMKDIHRAVSGYAAKAPAMPAAINTDADRRAAGRALVSSRDAVLPDKKSGAESQPWEGPDREAEAEFAEANGMGPKHPGKVSPWEPGSIQHWNKINARNRYPEPLFSAMKGLHGVAETIAHNRRTLGERYAAEAYVNLKPEIDRHIKGSIETAKDWKSRAKPGERTKMLDGYIRHGEALVSTLLSAREKEWLPASARDSKAHGG